MGFSNHIRMPKIISIIRKVRVWFKGSLGPDSFEEGFVISFRGRDPARGWVLGTGANLGRSFGREETD